MGVFRAGIIIPGIIYFWIRVYSRRPDFDGPWLNRTVTRLLLVLTGSSCLLVSAGCAVHSETKPSGSYPTSKAPDDWIAVGLPDDVGMDSLKLDGLIQKTQRGDFKNIHSILVIKDGKLVVEQYFNGFHRGDLETLRSATKSITSILVGIAIDKGLISSVNERIERFFPEYAQSWDERKRPITVRDLLTMTAGFDWDQSSLANPGDPSNHGSESEMERSDDMIKFVLQRPMRDIPGTRFEYNSGATILLAGILQKSSGMQVDEFARRNLFAPLGIERVDWWRQKRDGMPLTHAGLFLRPIDMAKIGYLVLNDGKWNGRQIVSEQWISQSTAPSLNPRYGYQWWLDSFRAWEWRQINPGGGKWRRIHFHPPQVEHGGGYNWSKFRFGVGKAAL